MHDGRIQHGADANESPRRRLGYTMRYLSAEVEVFPDRNIGHRLWLARGRPIAGNHYEEGIDILNVVEATELGHSVPNEMSTLQSQLQSLLQ